MKFRIFSYFAQLTSLVSCLQKYHSKVLKRFSFFEIEQRAYNLIIYVKTSIQIYEKGFHSPISVIDESHWSSSMFVSLEEFE